jgi:hypothetical protein
MPARATGVTPVFHSHAKPLKTVGLRIALILASTEATSSAA